MHIEHLEKELPIAPHAIIGIGNKDFMNIKLILLEILLYKFYDLFIYKIRIF